jgi:hypothetical protein
MQIRFWFLGQFVVDDVRQPFNVDTPGGDICRYQHLQSARLKGGKGASALKLAFITVNGSGADTSTVELLRKPIGPVLSASKD